MLRAIDVQQVVMQMEQAEKVQRVEQHHPDMQQRYLELQMKEEKKLRQKKVTDAEEASKTLIRDKKEREREGRSGADRRESERQVIQEEEDQDAVQQGGHINIKV
jgi:predicted AAA+ superfamily ATPase